MIAQIAQQTGASVRAVCAALELPRSSFYHAEVPTPTQSADAELGPLIEAVCKRHRRRYGYRRIGEELADRGVICAPARIRRFMARRGLRALQPKNFLPKTSDGRADKPSPNLLTAQPLPAAPNGVWAGDITFIPTRTGWLSLAVVIDLCSRRIVGWSLADHLRSDLVVAALRQALGTRRAERTIFHSDRGSQYGSTSFRQALAGAGMRQSMSARANPYDNAWTESFIGTLKGEMLQGGCFENADDARLEIFDYIEGGVVNNRLLFRRLVCVRFGDAFEDHRPHLSPFQSSGARRLPGPYEPTRHQAHVWRLLPDRDGLGGGKKWPRSQPSRTRSCPAKRATCLNSMNFGASCRAKPRKSGCGIALCRRTRQIVAYTLGDRSQDGAISLR